MAMSTDTRARIAAGAALFLLALGVRVLVWQNNKLEMAGVQWMLTHMYKQDAANLVAGDIGLFLAGPNPPSDANILLHPPGYPMFIAATQAVTGSENAFLIFQLLINSLSAALVFLIALRLFDIRTALIAGFLVALAPQLAYHSALMLPDELSVIPLLLGLLLSIHAGDTQRWRYVIGCGVCLGLSCWLRPNALLLPVFFAVYLLIFLPRPARLKAVAVMLSAFILTILPITTRNYVVFGSFIPISLGAGTTFIEGLGDYDTDGRLGLPITDEGVMEMDARLAGRPDYYGYLLSPDGIERERTRIRTGLNVVAENPVWFAASVAHRGLSTLRMERVPAIAPERDERETTPPLLYALNVPLKLVQRLFITATVLPLFLFGVFLLIPRARWQKLAVLAVVPLYYMTVQALIHTEYRYVLASTHILLIFAAVSLSFIGERLYGLVKKPSNI